MKNKLLSFVITASILGVSFFAGIVYRQDIIDWWNLRNFEPSARIIQIVDRTDMSSDGKKYFYIAKPVVATQDQFNSKCRSGNLSEFSIVLGCYINVDGIYLYDVKDKRLDGIVEVTAAHEMLHSAYDRLSSGEREEIDALTAVAFKSVKNERIISAVKQYQDQDASSVPNELHSILATEVADLPDQLENYYKKYFTNRQAVVALSNNYENEFTSRQNKVKEIENQLTQLKKVINTGTEQLESDLEQLKKSREELDTLLANGETAEYNARVDSFNAQVTSYNSSVNENKSLVNQYNGLVETYRAIALEIDDLYQSIDSRLQTL